MDAENELRADDGARREAADGPVGDPAVRQVLAGERLRTLALCRALRRDLDSIADARASSNADDEHDPEGATLAFERAQTAAMLDQSRSRLDDIDRAAQKHEQGTYGICEACGEAIPAERLAVRATARTCLACTT